MLKTAEIGSVASVTLTVAAWVIVSACLELSHLLIVVGCSIAYVVFQHIHKKSRTAASAASLTPVRSQVPRRPSERAPFRPTNQLPLRQESKVPVQAPSFQAETFSGQVSELLAVIRPSAASEEAALELARFAQSIIEETFPGAVVQGFANADVLRGTAFGVAVPELDLVVSADPERLTLHLQGRLCKSTSLPKPGIDARKLQKSAIRACTDHLVAVGGFKFRRSAFRCHEPKVTLMAPTSMSVASQGVPVDLWVNCATPAYHAALVAECKKLDARAHGLVLLVRRWAKDRGVCHVARGHLPPYAWTLLVVFYLQVREHPILPALRGIKSASSLEVRAGDMPPGEKSSVGELFKGFIGFYQNKIDWQKEAVSIRLGRRDSPNPHLKMNMVGDGNGGCDIGPNIEDPFEPAKNLADSLSSEGINRMKEELSRADDMLSTGQEVSLSELLEPWAPEIQTPAGSTPMSSGEGEEVQNARRRSGTA
mmetsp:Transcript_10846/g.19288  ORF Transcript_10846/g.19288 Transcript_10846/m.19288 type:complete len:482 (-) Transcript_10846:122-1567(-)